MTRIAPGGTTVTIEVDLSEIAIVGAGLRHGISCEEGFDGDQIMRARQMIGRLHRAADQIGDPPVTSFDFTVETAEGATFTPWTDGYAVGYKVTAPGLPDRYLFLNPSSDTGEDIFHTNAFVYLEADPADQVNTHHHYDIWEPEDAAEDVDAPDCSRCHASNAGSREAPHLCETCQAAS